MKLPLGYRINEISKLFREVVRKKANNLGINFFEVALANEIDSMKHLLNSSFCQIKAEIRQTASKYSVINGYNAIPVKIWKDFFVLNIHVEMHIE